MAALKEGNSRHAHSRWPWALRYGDSDLRIMPTVAFADLYPSGANAARESGIIQCLNKICARALGGAHNAGQRLPVSRDGQI